MTIKERNLNAAKYCARVTIEREKNEKRVDRFVKRLLITSIGLWMFAVTLALLVG